jgi:uncharacterized membrane protein
MSIATAPAVAARAKYALFAGVALMLAYVLYHNERFVLDPADPNWPHYRAIGRFLLPHGILGAVALALGCTQFSTRLRRGWPAVHRSCGRLYVAAVMLAAPLGAYIQYLDEQYGFSRSYTFATGTFALLWVYATLMAFTHIRARRIDEHRRWMVRSFAMALVFLEVRVVGGLTGWEDPPALDEIIVWACVALGYPLADTALEIARRLEARGRA